MQAVGKQEKDNVSNACDVDTDIANGSNKKEKHKLTRMIELNTIIQSRAKQPLCIPNRFNQRASNPNS